MSAQPLARAFRQIGGMTAVSRVLGFVRDVVFAALLGRKPTSIIKSSHWTRAINFTALCSLSHLKRKLKGPRCLAILWRLRRLRGGTESRPTRR